jgi:NADP-dependent 3-hydroxy acid dehydrogenase YdfG
MSNNKEFELGEVFNVKPKVAFVTGGGSSIGLMIAQTLAVNGAMAYIMGRSEEKFEYVAEVYMAKISRAKSYHLLETFLLWKA